MFKKSRRILCVLLCVSILSVSLFTVGAQADTSDRKIKNIIYMIPDGGGMAPFFLADYIKQAGGFSAEKYPYLTPVEQGEMYIKDYLVGVETTHSASHATTDSAAGGTALAGGYKTNNGMIGITPDYKPRATILEACQSVGMSTGMVVTHAWPDATPAAFSAHADSRTDYSDIGIQEANQKLDVLIGCHADSYAKKDWFSDAYLEERGYRVISTEAELDGIKPGEKIAGKIPALYYEIDKTADTPDLAEVTEAAIRALDDGNENGFFLMVEGSAIDGGGHDSSAIKQATEWLAFDEACKVAIEYAKKRTDTLVVILPDHDTGGLAVTKGVHTAESLEPIVEDVRNGTEPESLPWEGWMTSDANKRRSHTSRNGGIFMYLPEGVAYPEGIDISKKDEVLAGFEADFTACEVNRIDNTAITPYLASFIDVDLDELTDELFVDATDHGVFDAATGIFTMTTTDGTVVTVQENTSFATINGENIDLDGQVAVYVGERFYAPQILFDNIKVKDTGLSIYADYSSKTVRVEGVTETGLSDIAIVVTDPKKAVADSIGSDGFTSLPYISQLKSAPWREYSFTFKVDEGKIGDYKYYTRINNGTKKEEYTFSFKDMTVKKGTEVVQDMSQLEKGDSIDLVLSGYDSAYDGVAAVAQYDSKNNLVGLTFENLKGAAVEYGDYSSINATVLENTEVIRAYYWDRATLFPFAGVYVID